MNKNFFNRILHLLDKRPQQGKRMIGIGSTALWELWQRIAELDLAAQQKRAERAGRKRQAGGGRKKDAFTPQCARRRPFYAGYWWSCYT